MTDTTTLLGVAASTHKPAWDLLDDASSLGRVIEAIVADAAAELFRAWAARGPESIRSALLKVPFATDRASLEAPLGEVMMAFARRALGDAPELASDLERFAQQLRDEPSLRALLGLDLPLEVHPRFARLVAAARWHAIGAAAQLTEADTETLAARLGDVSAVSEHALRAEVRAKTLRPDQALALAAVMSLWRIVEGDLGILEGLRGLTTDGALPAPRDLTSVDGSRWARIIGASHRVSPGRESLETIERVTRRVANLFPTLALQAASRAAADRMVARASDLEVLFRRNEPAHVLGRSFDELDHEARDDDALARSREAHVAVVTWARRYEALGLASVLGDARRPLKARLREAVERVDAYRRFAVRLGARALGAGDLDAGDLDLSAVDPGQRSAFLALLGTERRILRLTRDAQDMDRLLGAGLTHSLAVRSRGAEALTRDAGLLPDRARTIHARAEGIATDLLGKVGLALDALSGGFADLPVSNLSTDIPAYFQALPGYAGLFGSQAHCACTHCRSILSPAAYFTDLMCFIEERVTQPTFGPHAAHPLALRARRPDLWSLPLTCENTHQALPTLAIVAEVLEAAVASQLGYPGDAADRQAVARFVYGTLAGVVDSFDQPIDTPLTELRHALRHFDRDLPDVARALHLTGAPLGRVALGLSPSEVRLIHEAETSLTTLSTLYGVSLQTDGEVLAPFNVQPMLARTGWDRDELSRVLTARFVTSGAASRPRVVPERSSPDAVQNDIERIHDATAAALDRAHRFTRLRRATGWTVGELDLVLTALDEVELGRGVSDEAATLELIARVKTLATRLGATLEETCLLFAPIPIHSTGAGASLLDRLFNAPGSTAETAPYPSPGDSFLHPALADAPGPSASPHLHRLQAATRLDGAALLRLVLALADALGLDPAATSEHARSFPLTRANLTLLTRHATLSRRLGVSVDDLATLLRLAGGPVTSLAEAESLVELASWRRGSPWALTELAAMAGLAAPYADSDAEPLAHAALGEARPGLALADTAFALLPDVTEDQSRAIVAINVGGLLDALGDGRYRVAASFTPSQASLTLPDGVSADPGALNAVLARHHSGALLPPALASALGLATERLERLLGLLDVDLASPPFHAALLGSGDSRPVLDAVVALRPLAMLLGDPDAAPDALIDLVADAPQAFGIASFASLGLTAVRRLAAARALVATGSVSDLATLLEAAPTLEPGAVARLLTLEPSLAASLASALTLPPEPFAALEQLATAATLARHLGVDGAALAAMVSGDSQDVPLATDALLASARARASDDAAWERILDRHRDAALGRRRDALLAYLTRSAPTRFADADAVYAYYLIDPQLDPCARTSRVIAGSASLQLYVERVRMGLERSPDDAPDAMRVSPEAIPASEWSWRRRYRLWEANRKVFLWPENWLEPTLRDDKTPQFEALEEELLAQGIDDDTVRDAYSRYLRGFQEVASLELAGAYHEVSGDAGDVLHLFGVTKAEPPTHYYRRVEQARAGVDTPGEVTSWGVWEKLEVQIPVRCVSPVMHQGRLMVLWVETVTQPVTQIHEGSSEFRGYRHRLGLKHTSRRLDGSWTAPQTTPLDMMPFADGDGVVLDLRGPLSGLRYDDDDHPSARDGYTLRGFAWERVYPSPIAGHLLVRGADFRLLAAPFASTPRGVGHQSFEAASGEVPPNTWNLFGPPFNVPVSSVLFPAPRLLWSMQRRGARELHPGTPVAPFFEPYTQAALVIERERLDPYRRSSFHQPNRPEWPASFTSFQEQGFTSYGPIVTFDPGGRLEPVNGSPADAILQLHGQLFHIQEGARADGLYHVTRLSTSLAEDIARALFDHGVDHLLATTTQLGLREAPSGLTVDPRQAFDATRRAAVDYAGPMGVYLREVFFHIPLLLADHLGRHGDHAAAQRWYHHVFDPTAEELVDASGSGLGDAERLRRQRDRSWRYRELRGLGLDDLRARLSDPRAITAYRRAPFNPHAIARLRLTAYQKWIVMRYVGNLLDWADTLFAEDTLESVGEATLLYVMAQEILGRRPVDLGDCGEAAEPTFGALGCGDGASSDFLIALEDQVMSDRAPLPIATLMAAELAVVPITLAGVPAGLARWAAAQTPNGGAPGVPVPIPREVALEPNAASGLRPPLTVARPFEPVLAPGLAADFGASVVRQLSLAFCVPRNEQLLAVWDRVADRLYKIRHCMNLQGIRRQLALLAPPIDPALLVRAQAAGLPISDVIDTSSGSLPPYRFRFLVDRAKGLAAMVQSFGAAVRAALERRDAEEMARLRNVHQKNLLLLTTQLHEGDIALAEEAIALHEQRITEARARLAHYEGLLEAGRTSWEDHQANATIATSSLRGLAAGLDLLAAIFYRVPDVGSPFALKFGGKQLGDSQATWATMVQRTASISESIASAAGLMGGFERRDQGWRYSRDLAALELERLERERTSMALRRERVHRHKASHEVYLAQHDEVMALFESQFSNLALFSFLESSLRRLHREAYALALGAAHLAERAFRFERPHDAGPGLAGGYWDSSRAGLLAGERLALDLVRVEQRFLETDHRQLEITQSFSLSQLDPAAVVRLRTEARCEFALGEVFYDLAYPGQYRRRLRAVRLTIPCITGAYTNISARLTLLQSWVRAEPGVAPDGRLPVPPSRTVTVATSSAQGDAGVFELGFRDERYLPFEGAGADSVWRLELPRGFRSFDYGTISDVVITVSYVASEDGALREQVEGDQAAAAGALHAALAATPLPRILSLRQEYSQAFHRLVHGAPGTPVELALTRQHLPIFLSGTPLRVAAASLVLELSPGAAPGEARFALGSVETTAFSPDPTFGGLHAAAGLASAFPEGPLESHTLRVIAPGGLAPGGGPDALNRALDPAKVRDILLVLELTVAEA